MLAIDDIAEVMRRNRLRWFGHVERRDELLHDNMGPQGERHRFSSALR